jgi:hypothetical protein
MVTKIIQNGILINYMDAQRWNGQMVAVIGGNLRMVRGKDMEQGRGLKEGDTSGNSWMMSSTGMESSDGLMKQYITESPNRVIVMGKDISGGQMEMNIGESTRMTRDGERESQKKREYYTEKNMMKASALAGVKYSEVLQQLSIN